MKKEYTKPELNTKAYAQFENVFTGCDQNPSETYCNSREDIPVTGAGHCRHDGIQGSN